MNTRLNVLFTEKQNVSLDKMAKTLGVTKKEVLRRAFSLLEVAIREEKEGNQIGVVKDGLVLKEIIGITR